MKFGKLHILTLKITRKYQNFKVEKRKRINQIMYKFQISIIFNDNFILAHFVYEVNIYSTQRME